MIIRNLLESDKWYYNEEINLGRT
jgi:phospholipid-translocating ATPase